MCIRDSIVAGGDKVRAQPPGVIEKGFKLDFRVAQDVRVRGPPRPVLVEKIVEHPLLIFGGEIDLVQRDIECFGHRPRILQILGNRAIPDLEGIFPVLHELSLIHIYGANRCANDRQKAADG